MLNTFFSHLSDLVKTFWPFPGSVFVLMVRVHIQRVELPGPVVELARGDDGDVEGGPGVQLHCLHTVRVVGLAGHGYNVIMQCKLMLLLPQRQAKCFKVFVVVFSGNFDTMLFKALIIH